MSLNPTDFIKQQYYGVLSTHSIAEHGYPFGSITPYMISPQGELCIYISELAEHTKNIHVDNKVCLTISDINNAANPNDGPRISCLAVAEKITNTKQLKQLYLQRFPDSEMTLSLPGFDFYRLNIQKIRLVAGFGKIKWLSAEQIDLS
jgi:hypothetical protein